jgi:hypothetical protein
MPDTLSVRLQSIRSRIRRLTWVHGVAWTALAAIVLLAGSAAFDWLIHASSGLRVLMLAGIAVGVAWAVYRYLIAPLSVPLRDLDLARRWESLHPETGETISSALEFAKTAENDPLAGSPSLRRHVVEAGLRHADQLQPGDVIEVRPVRKIVSLAGAAAFGVMAIAAAAPLTARTAMTRLFDPFGDHPWPKRTQIELVDAKDRIAKGDPFTVGVKISGLEPSAVKLQFKFPDGRTSTAEEMRQEGEGVYKGGLETAVQPFSYAITAGDDHIDWRAVEVVPAPEEHGLKLKVHFPAYTNLPAEEYPEGKGHVRAVFGSRVELFAGSNKPLARAELAWDKGQKSAATLGADKTSLTATFPVEREDDYRILLTDEEGMTNAERSPRLHKVQPIVDQAPDVTLEKPGSDGDVTERAVVPIRALVKDDFGVAGVELVYSVTPPNAATEEPQPEKRIPLAAPEDAPTRLVTPFEWSLEPLRLKGGSVLKVRVEAVDKRDNPGPNVGKSREIRLRIVSKDELLASIDGQQQRIREEIQRINQLQQNALKQTIDLARQSEIVGRLKPEDQEMLSTVETTQRNVRSKVSDPDQGLQKQVSDLIQELRNNRITDVESTRRLELVRNELGRINEQNLPAIAQALSQARKGSEDENSNAGKDAKAQQNSGKQESGKQGGESKSGDSKNSDGKSGESKSDAAKGSDAKEGGSESGSKANEKSGDAKSQSGKSSKSGDQKGGKDSKSSEGKQSGGSEGKQSSDFEGKEGGEQQSGKQGEQGGEQSSGEKSSGEKGESGSKQKSGQQQASKGGQPGKQGSQQKSPTPESPSENLQDAKDNQEKVVEALDAMLAQLDEWENSAQATTDARALLRQQNEAGSKTQDLSAKTAGKEREKLEKEEQVDIEKAADRQDAVRGNLAKLENLLARLGDKSSKEDPVGSATLKEALQRSQEKNLSGKMGEASRDIRENRVNEAGAKQQDVARGLADMIDALENRRELELKKLIQEMRKAEREGRELTAEQRLLRKQTQDAQKKAEAKEREDELKKLEKRQQQLAQKAEEMARKLSKMQSQQASRRASRSASRMNQAGQNMEKGEGQNAEKQQEEALQELNEAMEQLAQERGRKEEQLQQEQLAKIADNLRALQQRQAGVGEELTRLETAKKTAGKLSRGQMQSVLGLGRVEDGLGDETKALTSRLSEAKVFALVLEQAASRMKSAATRLGGRDLNPLARADVDAASNRLNQLLDSLKNDQDAKKQEGGGQQKGGEGGGGQGGGNQGGGDGIPNLAQIKLLIALQEEIKTLTTSLIDAKAKSGKWSADQEKEFADLSQRQGKLVDLVNDFAKPKGDGEDMKLDAGESK